MTAVRFLGVLVAAFATPFALLAATDQGGWSRFFVGLVILVGAWVILRRELARDRRPR